MGRLRSSLLLLPLMLLALGSACSRHTDTSTAAGTPPFITEGPADAVTVSGRPVSLSVTAKGAPTLRYQWSKDGQAILGALGSTYTLPDPRPQDTGHYAVTVTNSDGSITSSAVILTVIPALEFASAVGTAFGASGNLFVSDVNDHVIWKISPTNQKTLFAGLQGVPGSTDGPRSAARFRSPSGLAFDPSGNLIVADTGNHTLRQIAPDGTVTTLAGTPGVPGTADGVGAMARFNAPYGLAVAPTGEVYVADSQNHTIRLMVPGGAVSTYAGIPGMPGQSDGSGSSAQFNQPNGLALTSTGALFVSDYGNSCIRSITQHGAQVATVAGQAATHGYADGSARSAQFYQPVGIALDATGVLWIADTHNHAVRRLRLDGSVTTVAGAGGTSGNADGTSSAALFNLPCGIAVGPSGNLVVADTYNHILRNVTPAGVVTTFTTP